MLDSDMETVSVVSAARNARELTGGDDLRLFHAIYRSPQEVLSDGRLSPLQKRMLLSSWASDACAVESRPWLRHPPGASGPVLLEEVLEALKGLDRQSAVDRSVGSQSRKT